MEISIQESLKARCLTYCEELAELYAELYCGVESPKEKRLEVIFEELDKNLNSKELIKIIEEVHNEITIIRANNLVEDYFTNRESRQETARDYVDKDKIIKDLKLEVESLKKQLKNLKPNIKDLR